MTASHMHWPKVNGEAWTYKDDVPVPRRSYRCPATASERSPHNANLQRRHTCKITVDHDGDHLCICGKKWTRLGEEAI